MQLIKWINFEKVKPKKYNTYLIIDENKVIEIALYIEGKWHNDGGGKVKYWMSLPKKPKNLG